MVDLAQTGFYQHLTELARFGTLSKTSKLKLTDTIHTEQQTNPKRMTINVSASSAIVIFGPFITLPQRH